MVTSQQMPGHLNHVSGYAGFQPRCPTAEVGSAEWASIVEPQAPPEYMEANQKAGAADVNWAAEGGKLLSEIGEMRQE